MRKHPRPITRATALVAVCGFAVSAGGFSASATTEPPSSEPAASTGPAATTDAVTTATTQAPTTTVAPTTAAPTTAAPTTAAPTTAAPTTTVPIEVERQPLTGVPIDGTFITYTPRPALIVKIDNVGSAIPQAGLNQADIVFEEIVEGRATRFAAVFNSTESDPVGPIRSGRTQDVNLFASYNDPVFAYSGGNEGVNAALASTGWTLLTQGNGMFRDGSRPAPHNLFGNTSDFFAQAGESGDAVAQFEYIAPGAEVAGSPVASIDLQIGGYDVGWDWDATQGLFLRSQLGTPHQLTDGQATANTVIVLLVPYGTSSAAANSPEAQSLGSGAVVVYSNGSKIEGTWTRNDPSEPFALEAGGEPILIAPGRTWVELADAGNFGLSDA